MTRSVNGSSLELAFDWDRRAGTKLLLSSLGALVLLVIAVAFLASRNPWGIAILLVLFVPLVVLLGASAGAHLFNTTRINADFDEITVDVGPVASRRLNKRVSVNQLSQIGVRDFRHGANEDGSMDSKVQVHVHEGDVITLVNGVPEPAIALYIEQELERHLEIQNRTAE